MNSETDNIHAAWRKKLKESHRIVIKIGSSSLQHSSTGKPDLVKMEILVRELSDLRNQGKDVILVSSGAVMVGRDALGFKDKSGSMVEKQACASVGQAKLMMLYQKLFMEYNNKAAQVLLTFDVITNDERRKNAENTLKQLLDLDVVPIVNENDTVATDEIEFGDNDTLSAIVSTLIGADMLILLTDINGFYTDDPRKNPNAKRLSVIDHIDESLKDMAKGTVTSYGTGGMYTKIAAAQIACYAGADVAIVESSKMDIIHRLMDGEDVGTIFTKESSKELDLIDFIKNKKYLEK